MLSYAVRSDPSDLASHGAGDGDLLQGPDRLDPREGIL